MQPTFASVENPRVDKRVCSQGIVDASVEAANGALDSPWRRSMGRRWVENAHNAWRLDHTSMTGTLTSRAANGLPSPHRPGSAAKLPFGGKIRRRVLDNS